MKIRDWLTLEEEMLRQQAVVVGDVDDIHQVLDKQKLVADSCQVLVWHCSGRTLWFNSNTSPAWRALVPIETGFEAKSACGAKNNIVTTSQRGLSYFNPILPVLMGHWPCERILSSGKREKVTSNDKKCHCHTQGLILRYL
ncbi:hypothetical protein J6590_020584 [Homalodisca vitripennis]|nr:hypothetical protein J6590_020584 [Homalodisca vitripennis]